MSVVEHIIREELERLESLSNQCENEINQYPGGSISRKKISGREYIYLNYRIGKKIKSNYIGPKGSEKVKELEEKIKERKKYEDILKRAKQNIKEIRSFSGRKI